MINNKKSSINYFKSTFIKAFTLAEVIIATFVSSIVLSFIFIFLSDISSGIVDTKIEIGFMGRLYDFTHKLNNYRNVYTSGSILVNNTGSLSDIFIFRDESGANAILFGPIKLNNNKLYVDNTIYEERGIGFKRLSTDEIAEIGVDVNNIYDYVFQDDQIYSDLKLQGMTIESYNSGAIYDMVLTLNPFFNINLVGQYWSDLTKDDLKIFNIDF